MKALLLGFTLLLCFLNVSAQSEQVRRMQVGFEKYKSALIDKDYETLISLSHPRIVEMGGGKVYMIDDVKKDINMYEAIGVTLVDIQSKLPSSIIKAGDELHAMLPVERILKTPLDTTREANYFLATSPNGGASWYFVDMKKQDAESIKFFLPNYDSRLNVYLKQN